MSVKHTVENVYLRQDAAQLTRRHFWPLLGITIIITAITTLLDWGLTAIGDQLMVPEVNAVMDQYTYLTTSGQMTSAEPLMQAMTDLFTSPKFLLFNLVFMLVTTLVSSGLNLGRTRELLSAAQGSSPTVVGVLGLMKYCLKAWAVEIWCGVKILVWMLPGVGAMLLGSLLMSFDMDEIGNAVMVIGTGLVFGLFIPALIRYAMSLRFLADDPSRGIRECVRLSAGMMKDRKWQFFKLGVPVWLKILGAGLAANILSSILCNVLPIDYTASTYVQSALQFVAAVYFLIQMDMLYTLFYLKRRDPGMQISSFPKPVSDWLQEHTATEIGSESVADEAPAPVEEESAEFPKDPLPLSTEDEKENE